MVTFEYSRDVHSPSDRAGLAGETRELMFETAQILEQQGYGRIVTEAEHEPDESQIDEQ